MCSIKRNLFPILGLVVLAMVASCDKKADEADCDKLEMDITALEEQFQEDQDNFSMDQSIENCNNLKSTGETLVQKLKEYEPCVAEEEREEYNSDLQDLEVGLSQLLCD